MSLNTLVIAFVFLFHLYWKSQHETYLIARLINIGKEDHTPSPASLITTSVLLGIGTGGFIDGIIFHQILQWHQMLSHRIPPVSSVTKSVNMFWDGIFHACMLVILIVGILRLHHSSITIRIFKSRSILLGGALAGWGIFNVLEGILNHHIFKLHVVREFAIYPDLWNYGFLFFSVLLIGTGYGLLMKAVRIHYLLNSAL